MTEYLSRGRIAEIRAEALAGQPTSRATVLALLDEIERLSGMIERERELFNLQQLNRRAK